MKKEWAAVMARKAEMCRNCDDAFPMVKPNFTKLAEELGLNRRTVARYWYMDDEMPQYQRVTMFDEFHDEIRSILSETKCTVSAALFYFHMTYGEETKSWKYRNFLHYCETRNLVCTEESTAHPRFETARMGQSQVDFKEEITMHYINGSEVNFNIYGMTLGCSRRHLFTVCMNRTQEEYFRGTLECFVRLDGLTETILTDNAACIVNHNTNELFPEVVQFMEDIGFEIHRCRVKHPYTKGKQESAFRFVNWLKPFDGKIRNIDHLLEIVAFLEEEVNRIPNRTTGIAPSVLYETEKASARPLPNRALIDAYLHAETRKVSHTQTVLYKGISYSVPHSCLQKEVRLVPCGKHLYIYHDKRVVTIHSMEGNVKIRYHRNHYSDALKPLLIKQGVSTEDIEKRIDENIKLFDSVKKQPGR